MMTEVQQATAYVNAAGMISRKHAAAVLGVKPKTMCEWKAKGLGPEAVLVGGRVFYRWPEVAAFATGDL